MFTGLIQDQGRIEAIEARGQGVFARIRPRAIEVAGLAQGESIAVSGCCLTVMERAGPAFGVEISPETLEKTTLGALAAGDAVNLERALAAGDRLGGHLVLGHVDGVGRIEARAPVGDYVELAIASPSAMERWLVEKGSVTVDGVSLTVSRLEAGRFTVMLIPETLAATTLGERGVGDRVNLEGDVIGKYVERLVAPYAKEQK